MFCFSCGQQLPDIARFCMKCGTATITDASTATAETTPQDAPEAPTQAVVIRTYSGEVLQPQEYDLEPITDGQLTPYSQEQPAKDDEDDFIFSLPEDLEERVAYLLRKIASLRKTDRRKALRVCLKAVEIVRNNSGIYFELGEILQESHRYQEALNAYEQAIRIGVMSTSPFNVKARALERKADILKELRHYEEALSAIDESIKLDPQQSSSHKIRSDVLLKLGRMHESFSADHESHKWFEREMSLYKFRT